MKNKFDLLILFLMISIASLLQKVAGQGSTGKIIVTFSDEVTDYYDSTREFSGLTLTSNSPNVEISCNADRSNFAYFFDDIFEDNTEYIISIEFKEMNIAKITNMEGMFANLINLEKIVGLECLNTSEVTNMSYMFYRDINLNEIDVSSFRTSKVEDMSYMFANVGDDLVMLVLSGLEIPFKNFSINGLSNLDTSSVTNMEGMFEFSYNLESLDLSNFNTSKVTNMANMFHFCLKIKDFDISSFDTSSVTNMFSMFASFGLAIKLDDIFDLKDINNYPGIESLNLSNFDTSNVNNMSGMFYNCFHIKEIDVSSFNTSNVRDMIGMFENEQDGDEFNMFLPDVDQIAEFPIQKIIGLSKFDTSSVTSMEGMFYLCANIESLDLSNFNTTSVNDMEMMFYECRNLKYLDISNFNMTNIEQIDSMFVNLSNIKYINIYNIQKDEKGSFVNSLNNSKINHEGLSVCQKEIIIKYGINICCPFDFEINICSNYIIAYYKNQINYENGFEKDEDGNVNIFRENISFILNGDSKVQNIAPLTIAGNTPIKIYFSQPMTSFKNFFNNIYDKNV